MNIVDLLLYLLIAGICGSLGQAITGYSRGGCLVAIVLGFIGAMLGMKLSEWLKLPELLRLRSEAGRFRSSGRSSARRCSLPS